MTFLRRPRNLARQPALFLFLAAWLMCAAPVPVRSEDSTNSVKSGADLAQERNRQQRQYLPFAKGTLTDIDVRMHRLRLKTVDGVRTFFYTERTYIFRGKDKVAVDSLKVGEIVAVRFNTGSDGVSTLARIKAYGPPVPGAPPPGPEPSSNLSP